jgi:hypothetical protein
VRTPKKHVGNEEATPIVAPPLIRKNKLRDGALLVNHFLKMQMLASLIL